MSTLTASIELNDVTYIERRGIGPVYRAALPLSTLYRAVKKSIVRYAPRYQRGFRNFAEKGEADLDLLLPVMHPELQLDARRSQAMAVKFLQGRLFTSYVTWNARHEVGEEEPSYDEERRTLTIETDLTIPDTGHRHLAYYLLGDWKENPGNIPANVEVDGTEVSRETIEKLLESLELEDEYVYCDVYVLDAKSEGYLYDEFNADAKPPARAVAIDLNPTKTPSRRFVKELMDTCRIFSRVEVETRGNTIGSKSRKLTTNSTLEGAVRPMQKQLAALEKDQNAYKDLVEFTCRVFEEWAKLFPAFAPEADGDARHKFREESFALSNIMFFPLFQLIFERWEEDRTDGRDWHTNSDWKTAIAKLGGTVTATNPDSSETFTGPIMSRDNPEWIGRILIKTFDQDGNLKGYSLSSTRQTRQAAYDYLRNKSGLANAKVARQAA